MKKIKYSMLMLICFVIILTGSIYAWFELTQTHDLDIEPGTFEISIEVYFDDIELTLIDDFEEFYNTDTHILTINAFDVDEVNHINKLKVQISIQTHNSARVRIRVQEEWIVIRDYLAGYQTTRIIPGNIMNDQIIQPFNIHEDFFQVAGDPHYYYDGIINQADNIDIVFINGGINRPKRITDTFTETIYVRFSIYVDVVQANRFAEVWNVSDSLFG
jgi:hypothetical protein